MLAHLFLLLYVFLIYDTYSFRNNLHDDILAYFKIGTVFDIDQTNMPIHQIQDELNPILEDNQADDIINIFIKAIYMDGYKVILEM